MMTQPRIGTGLLLALLLPGGLTTAAARISAQENHPEQIVVTSVRPRLADQAGVAVQRHGLTREDYQRLIEHLPTLRAAIPERRMPARARVGEAASDVALIGTTPEHAQAADLKLVWGRFLTAKDVATRENVAVISLDLSTKLFGEKTSVGKDLLVAETVFTIVGIVAQQTKSGDKPIPRPEVQDLQEVPEPDAPAANSLALWVPITTMRVRFGDVILRHEQGVVRMERLELSRIVLIVQDLQNVVETAEHAERLLQRHHPENDVRIQTFPFKPQP
jgi:putative ABC transport system permease protein